MYGPWANKQHDIALILPLGLYVVFLSRSHFLAPSFTPLTLMSLSGFRASLLLRYTFIIGLLKSGGATRYTGENASCSP